MNNKIQEFIDFEKISTEIIPIHVFRTEQITQTKCEKKDTKIDKNTNDSISIPLFGYETNEIEVFYKPISRVMNPDKIIRF